MSKKILLKRSSAVTDEGSAKLPEASDLRYGELALNYASGYETLSLKNSDNEIIGFDVNAANALRAHIQDMDNPHETSKEQIGLGNVDNTADVDKPVSTLQQAALDDKLYAASVEDEDDTTDENVANDTYGIVNNLVSTSSDKALSAYQGYLLAQQLDDVTEGNATDLSDLTARVVALEEEVDGILDYIENTMDVTVEELLEASI